MMMKRGKMLPYQQKGEEIFTHLIHLLSKFCMMIKQLNFGISYKINVFPSCRYLHLPNESLSYHGLKKTLLRKLILLANSGKKLPGFLHAILAY